jgi:putative copper resistance protein D
VTQAFGIAVRWAHLASCIALVGICATLILAGRSDRPTARRWHHCVVGWARWLVLLAMASGLAALALQTALLEGRAAAALEISALARVALETQAGSVWLARHGLLLLLAGFLAMRAPLGSAADWAAARGQTALLGTLALALLSFAGHAVAAEPNAAQAIVLDIVHVVAAGVWIGGLLPLARLLRDASVDAGADARPYAVLAARRFSRCALVAVALLLITGIGSAVTQVGDFAALVGTPYGRLLLVKLVLVLPILAVARLNRQTLPELSGDGATVGRPAMRRLAGFAGVELTLALGLLLVVAAMNATPPARHEQPTWPFAFRLSAVAVADAPEPMARVLIGSQIAVLGLVAAACALVLRRQRGPALVVATVLLASGAALALPPMRIDAYPLTYHRPAVPYHASSIAAGAARYAEHCAVCHGRTGAGDGPGGLALLRPPADLRGAHTTHHTAGDLFWWIGRGIPAAGMPGFATRLAEDERWDLVNFVRAIGAAEAARRLGPVVEPDRPRLVAPDFAFAVGPTPPRALKDYRSRRIVLLVLYTLPASRLRLTALASRYDTLVALGVEIVAVPRDGAPDAIKRLGAEPRILFPVVTEGAGDIVRTYSLFARQPHAEFLIDRQGYLRAIDAGDAAPDVKALLAEVQQLNDEKVRVPIASEHVH